MKIYHEPQESALCGQHCLNNLLQGPVFSAPDLSEMALSLDARERSIASEDSARRSSFGPSNNVDESGNFSLEVLRTALQLYSVQLLSWASVDEAGTDPLKEELGFIINRQSHWFTIRKINGRWWNLNSTSERPEPISAVHLAAFLSQLRSDHYYVFIARGTVSAINEDDFPSGGVGTWYEEGQLLSKGDLKTPAVIPFSGKGHKLGETTNLSKVGPYEDDLARAIALSIQGDAVLSLSASKQTAKEELRAKRLAALDSRHTAS
jgi:ataxin-3